MPLQLPRPPYIATILAHKPQAQGVQPTLSQNNAPQTCRTVPCPPPSLPPIQQALTMATHITTIHLVMQLVDIGSSRWCGVVGW